MNIGKAQKISEERGFLEEQKFLEEIRRSKMNDLVHDIKKIQDTFEPFSKVHLMVGFPECYRYILNNIKVTMTGKRVSGKSLRWFPKFQKMGNNAVVNFENLEWRPTVIGIVEKSVVVFNHDTGEWLRLKFSEESDFAKKMSCLLQYFLRDALKD